MIKGVRWVAAPVHAVLPQVSRHLYQCCIEKLLIRSQHHQVTQQFFKLHLMCPRLPLP